MGKETALTAEEIQNIRAEARASAEGVDKDSSVSSAEKNQTRNVEITASEDKLHAMIKLGAIVEGDDEYDPDEIVGLLKKKGITFGVNKFLIVNAIKDKVYDEDVIVANGVPVEEGHDGFFEFMFETETRTTPAIREDGTTDYGAVGRLQNVDKGEIIAVYHKAQQGSKGCNVYGIEATPKMCKDLQPLRGKHISRDDETGEYRAEVAGKISYNNGNIEILDVHEINDDVTYAQGKIEFYGDIIINGNVDSGVFIRAGRNVTIAGTVNGATILAGGDIVLQKGVQGGGKGVVSARGNVFSDFIEFADVKAREDVYANSIINSEIHTEGSVVVSGKYGSIIGGKTYALRGITTNAAGNDSEIKTYLHVGATEQDYHEYTNLSKDEKQKKQELEELGQELETLVNGKNKGLAFLKPTKSKIDELTKTRNDLVDSLNSINDKKDEIKRRMAMGANAAVVVRGHVHRNVVITVDATPIMILKDEEYTKYSNTDGVIKRTIISV